MIAITAAVVTVLMGIAIASFAILHERDWRVLLRDAVVVDGVVVAECDGSEYSHAEIEYELGGKQHRFVSKYGTGMLSPGHHVRVAINTMTGDAERVAYSTRWGFTIGPILLGGLFVLVGISIAVQYGG